MSGLWPTKEVEGASFIRGRASGGTATTLVDDTKNLQADVVKDKIIKIVINGVEYVRKITANTADTISFAALVAKVAAVAVIEKTGAGKVTITAVPEGIYANEFQVVVVAGEGVSADTTAVFEDGVLTITLGTDAGTKSSAAIGAGENGVVTTVVDLAGVAGDDYDIVVAEGVGENVAMTAVLDEDTITVTLGTDALGDLDPTKNTAALIAAAISLIDGFTATASGDGSTAFTEAIASTPFTGGVDPVVDATAADVVAEVDALDEFSAAETTAGLLEALGDPVEFSGGVDEVTPVEKTEYYITLG